MTKKSRVWRVAKGLGGLIVGFPPPEAHLEYHIWTPAQKIWAWTGVTVLLLTGWFGMVGGD